jgi:hypothetical protein
MSEEVAKGILQSTPQWILDLIKPPDKRPKLVPAPRDGGPTHDDR